MRLLLLSILSLASSVCAADDKIVTLPAVASSSVDVESHYTTESSLAEALYKFNAFKRAIITHEGDKFTIYSGGIGSGFRVFNTFIFRHSDNGLFLVYQSAFDSTRKGYVTAAVYPEIREDGVTIFAQTRNGDVEVDRVLFSTLHKRINTAAEQDAAANP